MTHYFISNGMYDLDVLVADDADLDGTFEAICIDTGDTLRINGWQANVIERVED
jgi:hypothetical protein